MAKHKAEPVAARTSSEIIADIGPAVAEAMKASANAVATQAKVQLLQNELEKALITEGEN
jgi:hypothetical protein